MFTGREYDSEIGLYYNRARYYNPKFGRFISQDPIGQVDDVNLYAYVGNNPVNAVDLSGLTKVLIFVWNPSDESQESGFKLTVWYQIEQALKRWVKWENIKVVTWIMTPEQFNKATKPYLWDINQIIYIAHWQPDKSWWITNENLSQLEPVKADSSDNPNMLLISCSTWRWDDSIAQRISTKLDISVTAPTQDITVYEPSDLSLKGFLHNKSNFFKGLYYNLWEPTIPWWEWKSFK